MIKLASTWQGIKAAEQLEKEGIACNITLLFSKAQAIACAEANVTLISPFVGRILDWFNKSEGKEFFGAENPGVVSVTSIYNYYKQYEYKTVVMGASFRNTGEIIELAGCDLLTISPTLLSELQATESTLATQLSSDNVEVQSRDSLVPLTESTFAWQHNEDAMASGKLAEGIRNFAKDQAILDKLVSNLINQNRIP